MLQLLGQGLTKIKTDFSKWKLFFCDERVVPENDPESTYGCYKAELKGKIGLKDEQFVKIKQGVTGQYLT